MAEHPHVGLLGRLVRAIEAGDLTTIAALFAEHAVWHLPGDGPAESQQGREAILGLLGRLLEDSGGEFRVALYEAVPDGDDETWWCRLPSARRDLVTRVGLTVRVMDERIVEVWQHEGWPG